MYIYNYICVLKPNIYIYILFDMNFLFNFCKSILNKLHFHLKSIHVKKNLLPNYTIYIFHIHLMFVPNRIKYFTSTTQITFT